MKAQVSPQKEDHAGLHFLARGMGVLAVLTLLLYVRALLADSFLSVSLANLPAGGWLIGLLIVGAVALLAAWRWEWIGGLVAAVLALPVALYLTFVGDRDWFTALIYASPLLIAGLLYAWDARTRAGER